MTRFVAEFVGESNMVSGAVREAANGRCTLETADGPLRGRARQAFTIGSAALISVRPERVRLEPEAGADGDRGQMQGTICGGLYMGRARNCGVASLGGP